MARFSHLHLHTEYSLLDGFVPIKKLFNRLKELEMTSVAITDHGSMFGALEFYKEAKKNNIKPIIGCEMYISNGSYLEKDRKRSHLVLLVKNEEGYQNLIKLVSESYIRGFYYKPRIDYHLLKEHSSGLIALSACLSGDVQKSLLNGNYEEAKKFALKLKDIFSDDFYLEIQDHNTKAEKLVAKKLITLSRELDIKLVATNDVHYINKVDSKTHDILLCLQTGKLLSDEDRMKFPSDQYYLKSEEEMLEVFDYIPEAVYNTEEIVSKCHMEFDFTKRHLPEFKYDGDNIEYLKELCFLGLKRKYPDYENHIDRLNKELDIIIEMGFVDYFLIVWDFIRFSKENDIAVGPGRGSAGGSLVAYTLNITEVDPIKYDLIFERFLNPERVTMPDIDIDFEDVKRQKVIDYVINKYGKDHVAQIVTFGTMAARGSIRDVGRVLEHSYYEIDRLAKYIPFRPKMTLDLALKESEQFNKLYNENNELRKIINIAKELEGMPRHTSTHAAGIVISKKTVDSYVPLSLQDGNITTQYPMNQLEELGLLKMDFLGLRTLTVIKEAKRLIKENHGIEVLINPDDNDKKTYDMISKGDTKGIFQLESKGMIRFMKELKPSTLEDIIAGISLYRPGPMDSIPTYIHNKNHPEDIKYLHPLLEPILNVTYGCIVYQEQVMEIVRKLAGFSYGRSDIVRRAMSKKKIDVMEREKNIFINGLVEDEKVVVEGCLKRGVSKAVAETIFSDISDFANYAFNKSHAAGYSILIYETAYLKAHYPVEFMTATMSSMVDNQSKILSYIHDCNHMGIKMLPPDINKSFSSFSVEDGNIRFALKTIKNVGKGIIKNIIANRPFKNFIDFVEKSDPSELNKRAVEALIKAGAFDNLGNNRAELLAAYERIIDRIVSERRKNSKNQLSLFSMGDFDLGDVSGLKIATMEEMEEDVRLNFEKDALGMYLSGHPLNKYKDKMEVFNTISLADVYHHYEDVYYMNSHDDKRVQMISMITNIKEMKTKAGKKMAILRVEDLYDSIEVVLFPKIYLRMDKKVLESKFIILNGKLSIKDDEFPKIIAESIRVLSDELIEECLENKKIFIKLKKDKDLINKVIEIMKRYPGEKQLVFYFEDTKEKMMPPEYLKVSDEKNLIHELKNLLGEDSVKRK